MLGVDGCPYAAEYRHAESKGEESFPVHRGPPRSCAASGLASSDVQWDLASDGKRPAVLTRRWNPRSLTGRRVCS
jgi:hypothetical protein